MIIIKLTGGLGNQMFQYALGLHLAIKNKTSLMMDLSVYEGVVPDPQKGARAFSLKPFNLSASPASGDLLLKFNFYLKNIFFKRLLRFYSRPDSYFKRKYIIEPSCNYFRFDQRIVTYPIKGDVYVEGYWQTEKYFKEIEDEIRKEFLFKDEPDEINATIIREMENVDSVSIHIRRGDNAISATSGNGLLPNDYYYSALAKVIPLIKNPVLYIFSDDPKWVESNLKFNYKTIYISHNGDEKNYEDLRLMTHCKHHILGNSTFSWWGAWLGKKKDQIVVAPKTYQANVDVSDTDFLPKEWVRI